MTMAFITMSGAELCHSFNVKSHHSVFNKQVFNNKYLYINKLDKTINNISSLSEVPILDCTK